MAFFGLIGKKKKKGFSELDKAINVIGGGKEKPVEVETHSDLGLPIRGDGDFSSPGSFGENPMPGAPSGGDVGVKIDTLNAKLDSVNQRLINIEKLLVKMHGERNR